MLLISGVSFHGDQSVQPITAVPAAGVHRRGRMDAGSVPERLLAGTSSSHQHGGHPDAGLVRQSGTETAAKGIPNVNKTPASISVTM